MTITMVRTTVEEDKLGEAEAATVKMFAAIDEAQPEGVRYAATKLADGTTFVILLQLEGDDNPLFAVPGYQEFQESIKGWVAAPPTVDQLTVIGSFRLFFT